MIILTIPILLATLNGKNSYYYCHSNSDHTHTQKNGTYIYICNDWLVVPTPLKNIPVSCLSFWFPAERP